MAIDPPYRLDPFQNIVNVRWGQYDYISTSWFFSPTYNNGYAGSSGICSPVIFTVPEGALGVDYFLSSITHSLTPGSVLPSDAVVSGTPTIDPMNFSFGDWTCFTAHLEAKTVHAATGSFNMVGEAITSDGEGCYGPSGGDVGSYGGGYIESPGTLSSFGSVDADASGVTASLSGVTFNLLEAEITTSGEGILINIVWKRP